MIKIGITHGDYNGIGYEVILKTLDDSRLLELMTPVIYGNQKIAAFYRRQLGLQEVQTALVSSAASAKDGQVNIVNVCPEPSQIEPGKPTKEAGEAALMALQQAVDDLRNGTIDALVTAPINKDTIQSDSFHFPGHTEFLQAQLGAEGDQALMILFSDKLRVALATTHMPLADISSAISTPLILDKIRALAASLVRDFSIVKPRIAVLSLNPHTGENGLLGSEEKDIIIPAVEQAQAEKILCFGPYAADGFFGSRLYEKFDGVLAMYHDQGLAPFKTIAMERGVNFTAGLPFVRTSPDHGTGYDIAGQDKADPTSLREAIYAAIDIYRSRQNHAEMTANPLRKQYFEKGRDNVVLDLTKDS